MLDGDLESVTADIGKRIATLTSKGHNASEFTDYDFTTNPSAFLEGMGTPPPTIVTAEELIKKNLLPQ